MDIAEEFGQWQEQQQNPPSLADEFGQWRANKDLAAPPFDPSDYTTIPGGPIAINALKDVANQFGKWWEGAKQGGAELGRAQDQLRPYLDQVENVTNPDEAAKIFSAPEARSAGQYYGKAADAFANETLKPASYAAALVPGVSMAVALPAMLTDGLALNKQGGIGNVVKEFSGAGPVMRAIENPEDFAQRFINEPVTTAAELLPVALLARGAYGGVKGLRGAAVKPLEVSPELLQTPTESIVQEFGRTRSPGPVRFQDYPPVTAEMRRQFETPEVVAKRAEIEDYKNRTGIIHTLDYYRDDPARAVLQERIGDKLYNNGVVQIDKQGKTYFNGTKPEQGRKAYIVIGLPWRRQVVKIRRTACESNKVYSGRQ